jgi:K+-sensing histidine kinase KdpD
MSSHASPPSRSPLALRQQPPFEYALALVLVLAAALVSGVVERVLDAPASFFAFLVAVAIAALRGGALPGLLATVASGALVSVVLFQPLGLPVIASQADKAALALFAIEALAISGLGEFVRRGRMAMERSAAANAQLLAAERAARSDAERAKARAEGLEATAAALGRAVSTTQVADIAVRQGLQRLGAGRGVVGLLEPDGHTVRTIAAIGFDHDVIAGYPTFDVDDRAPLSEAIRLREPLVIPTTEELVARYPMVAQVPASGGPAVVVPLVYEDRTVGGMYFRYTEPNAIAEADKPYLGALGRQCAAALERARLFDAGAEAWADARKANDRMAFLAKVGDVLAEAPGDDAALTQIAQLAVPGVADLSVVFLLQPDQTIRLLPIEESGEAPEARAAKDQAAVVREFLTHRPPRLDDPFGAGAAISSGTVQLVTDYRTFLETVEMPAEARRVIEDSGVRSVMHCPLVSGTVVYGALTLATIGDRAFAAPDAAFGEELGRRVGTVLEKVRLNGQLAGRLGGQEAVARLGQLALVNHELGPVFQAAVKELSKVLDADIVAIMEHIPARHGLRIVAGSGWTRGVVGRAFISDAAESHSGFALVSDGPVVSRDYALETRFKASPLIIEHGGRSGVTTPILGPDGPWGVLAVHSRAPAHFAPDQIALLDTFANVLGSAVSRRSVEIDVRDRDDRLELALAASRTGFWEWNIETGRILWSDEICRLHGMPPGTELESIEAYLELIHPDDRELVRTGLTAAAENGAFDARFRILVRGNEIRWLRLTAKVFFGVQQRAVRVIGVGQDITEEVELDADRIRIAEAERRANELGQAFIGVVSHELRTPITSIFAGSKLLRRMDGTNPERRAELTADIEAEAERLYRLTEDLLVLTRVERGTLEMGMEPVALPRVLERVIASEQERWPLTTIELIVQPGLPIALGDNTYIEQLIRNLVGNAAKYAPQGDSVQVVATATQPPTGEPSELEVRVLDRGPGLAEEDLDHVFELFYRSPLTAKKAPGAGIGLFVCNQLALAMGGRLWAANRADGGSEFGFSVRAYTADDVKTAPGRALEGARSPAVAGEELIPTA